MSIILTTLNARYIHTAMGLRYLYANMGALQKQTEIAEFTIQQRPSDVAEKILALKPRIVGLAVYIWNVELMTELAAILKLAQPELTVVVGGPEVSFEADQQLITQYADYVVSGAADHHFRQLCESILAGEPPKNKFQTPLPVELPSLVSPYAFYSEDDIAHRIIYVEASRGCPFKCSFCLSALDKTAVSFNIDQFLDDMAMLYEKGVRHFKFVDRTFNLKVEQCQRILDFFYARLTSGLFLHFELIPDRLPEKLKAAIQRFPRGVIQFEIGVQSFNSETQNIISRKQDDLKTEQNLRWICNETGAHIHSDLIFGLPGEDLESFAKGFDRLVAMGPHEIQLGILKRLRGTPITRLDEQYQMRYNPLPPYQIISHQLVDFETMQRVVRFARYWDMVANSGRFAKSVQLLLAETPFSRFMQLSDWLYLTTSQTHGIALKKLFDLLFQGMTETLHLDETKVRALLSEDYQRAEQKGLPQFLQGEHMPGKKVLRSTSAAARQARHH